VEGRWVVPGAVSVFTSRGTRMLTVNTGGKDTPGFQVLLPPFPARRIWSGVAGSPTSVPGSSSARPAEFSIPGSEGEQSDPHRETGTIRVVTTASWFRQGNSRRGGPSTGQRQFRPPLSGKPLVIEGKTSATGDATEHFDRIDDVALLAGPRPAFLIHVDPHRRLMLLPW
jgi:hypothetical protein